MKALNAIAILLTAMLLQGCVAVVAGGAAVATKTATDPRSVGTQVDDSTLELRVTNALAKDQQIKTDARIIATAYQGKVLLTGQAPSQEIAGRAKQITMGVDGATEVYNEIRTSEKASFGTASSDTWITTKVKSTLLAEDATPGMDIEVETKNGVVSLSGTVATEAEKEAAVAKARQIKGVTDVSADGLKVAE